MELASSLSSNQSPVPLPAESSSMAVAAVSNSPNDKERKKRTSDPNNGKICHQCRQRTMNFMVSCKKMKRDKLCSMQFCEKCLINRYGLEAKEVAKIEDWTCPKCQYVCNCSMCRKQKGQRATGILIHEARQNGFKSVHELLEHRKGSEALNSTDVANVPCAAPDRSPPNKDSTASERSHDKDNTNRKTISGKLECNQIDECEASDSEVPYKACKGNIVLPQGSPLVEIAGIKFSPEDLGQAYQFLEFCMSFAKVLDIEKGQPEHILRDIVSGRIGCRGLSSPVVRFNIKLLSIIEKDIYNENWVQALGRRITKSRRLSKNLPGDTFEKGLPGYDSLEQSAKLNILNFLCDEILGTEKVRNYIDEENAKFFDEKRGIKEKVLATKKEERILRQQVRDDLTNALVGASPSIPEHDHATNGIRTEAEKKHAELLEYTETLHKKKQSSEASGMGPILLEGSGHAYWKLRSYNNSSNILLQDIGTWDSLGAVDKWYFFNEQEEKAVDCHIASARTRKRKRRRSTRNVSSDNANGETDSTDANPAGDITLTSPVLDKTDDIKAITDTKVQSQEECHMLVTSERGA